MNVGNLLTITSDRASVFSLPNEDGRRMPVGYLRSPDIVMLLEGEDDGSFPYLRVLSAFGDTFIHRANFSGPIYIRGSYRF